MGWNAGGYGSMTFANPKAMAAWKASKVSASDFSDWVNELEHHLEPEWKVSDSLKTIAKYSKWRGWVLELTETKNSVTLMFDTHEDAFRDYVGQLALTFRSAAAHGATGVFHFLGTAGAEYSFVYELKLAKGTSTLKSLDAKGIAKIYESKEYSAFSQGLMQRLMDADPAFKKIMNDIDARKSKKARK